jgi:hypothetical protein
MVIHGGVRFAGADPGIQNFELEELIVDPSEPGVGRVWINVTENRVKYTARPPTEGALVEIITVMNNQDYNILINLLAQKVEPQTTLSGYGILDAVATTDPRLNYNNKKIVKKTAGENQFTSIAAALACITDASETNSYLIKVEPGKYIEPQLVMIPYVKIDGSGEDVTIVESNDPNIDLVIGTPYAALSQLTLTGSTAIGKSLISMNDPDGSVVKVFRTDSIRFGSADTLVSCISGYVVVSNSSYGESAVFSKGFIANNAENMTARIAMRNCSSNGMAAPFPEVMFKADGVKSQIVLTGTMARSSSSMNVTSEVGVGIHIRNGGRIRGLSSSVVGFQKGIWAENAGSSPLIECEGMNLSTNVMDLVVDHPGTYGSFHGSATRSKVSINPDVNTLSVLYSDVSGQGFVNVGPMYVGKKHTDVANVAPLISRGVPTGLLDGGVLSRATGTTITIAEGTGYVKVNNTLRNVSWVEQSMIMTPGQVEYVYVDNTGTLQKSVSMPNSAATVVLGRTLTGASSIVLIGTQGSLNIEEFHPNLDKLLRKAIGPIYVSGSIVTENTTTPRAIDITAGHYFFSTGERLPDGKIAPLLLAGHHVSGVPTISAWAVVDNNNYDDGTDLVPLTTGYYTKHILYTNGNAANAAYLIAHGNGNYATLDEAILGSYPTPVFSPDGSPTVAAIIVQQGNPNIVQIIDIRPRAGFAAGTTSAAVRHGDMIGLDEDNHVQYFRTDGTRPMIGNLDLDNHALINVLNINGVDVSSHATRHTPNGADPLPTTGPVNNLTATSINDSGTANTFSRSDHSHRITGFQLSNVQLTALAELTGSGVVKRNINGSWEVSAIFGSDIPNLDWSVITSGKPTTAEGYGITNLGEVNLITSFYTGNIGAVSGNSITPYDSTPPLSVEGSQVWSIEVEPKTIDSRMVIDFCGCVDTSSNNRTITIAFYRGTTLIGFTLANISGFGRPESFSLHVVDIPGVLTPVTYSCRIGVDSSTTWYLGRGSSDSMGGANRLSWTIAEVL